jgi:hypothetical protein
LAPLDLLYSAYSADFCITFMMYWDLEGVEIGRRAKRGTRGDEDKRGRMMD